MTGQRPAVRRWPWILGGVALVAVIAIPFSIRARGRARYDAVRARLAAAGLGGGVEELKRGAPPVDPSLQARWGRVVAGAATCALQRTPLWRGKVTDWLNGGGPEPEGVRAAFEADANIRADAAALLEEGVPVAGLLGNWLAAGGGRVNPLGGMRCENLLGVMNLAHLFLVQAAFEDDPGPALAALDRMHGAFAFPGTLMDGLIGVSVADFRDETYARLAAAGRLPREAADRWLSEEPVEPLRVAFSIRGERVLFLEPIAEGIDSGALSGADLIGVPGAPSGLLPWMEGRSAASAWWLHGGEACARVLEFQGEVEAAVRASKPLPALPDTSDSAGGLAGMLCSNMHSVASTALAARQRHRLARAFVRALRAPVEGVLSADGPGDLPFVVEWTGPERLRVRSDGSGPLPPDPEGPRKPFVWGNGFVEADLPPSAR